jgi:hypothetical protein
MTLDDAIKLETGRSFISSLLEARQWSPAHRVWQAVMKNTKGDVSPTDWLFWNGGFEHEVAIGGFDWTINSSREVEAQIDTTQHHEGQQSLRLEFKQHQKVNFSGVAHALWVNPSTVYRLRFYYKTDGVPEDTGLAVVLTDAEAPARLSLPSGPLIPETEWSLREMMIQTPEGTRALRLQIVRKPVGRVYDYVEGRVWFDSFSLEPVERGPAQSDRKAGA